MITLNLNAVGKEQTLIKEYLEQNATEMLADKINNGVRIEKENKTLLNKKDLKGFMEFANDEARKLAEKGANYACIEDNVVFGWATHYFEEDSIEGILYNEDGTEFKPAPKVTTTPKVEPKITVKKEKQQVSLFDFMNLDTNKTNKNKEECEIEEDEENYDKDFTEPEINEVIRQENYDNLTVIDNRTVDVETGEIIELEANKTSSIDKEFAIILHDLLDGKLEVK